MISNELRSELPAIRPVSRGLLVRYRVMAFTTAALLIVLVFVGIPLQVAAGRPEVVNVVGTLHGFLYIAYLYVAFSLTRKLGVPKWQMALVLLAGTVPFCALVAERKMTKRFEAASPKPVPARAREGAGPLRNRSAALRERWLSRRALLLHLEVVIIAPGCALAGWWQATRALGGNKLSWAYSVEWPVFAILAIAGWWHLIHEDPGAYRARKAPLEGVDEVGRGATAAQADIARAEAGVVDAATTRLATTMAVLVGFETILGIMGVLAIPFSRPSGWLPSKGEAIYLTHSVLGAFLAVAAVGLLFRLRGAIRISRALAWMGLVGVTLAGVGGLLTEVPEAMRFLGMSLMLIGTLCAGSAYMVPRLIRSRRRL